MYIIIQVDHSQLVMGDVVQDRVVKSLYPADAEQDG